jgi:hypothetical protein
MADTYLFPIRQTRRDFLKVAGTALTAACGLNAADAPARVVIGDGAFRYELDPTWGRLTQGMSYGYGCAVVVDGQDRIFVTSRSTNPCVAIFDKDGQLLETWSKDFGDKVGYTVDQIKDTAHGLFWSREGKQEFLYWTENASTNKQGPKFGRRVYKTDLMGKVLYTLGPGVKSGSESQPFDFTNPTDVAVAPNGDIYVVDGYGSQKVHRFDKNFKWLQTIGGPGKDHGQFNVCHGVWVRTLGDEPEVYIADRHNDRIEVFSLDLKYKRTVGDIRTPCCFYQHQGHLFIPELGQRVTVMDAQDKVVARLGDGKGFEKEIAKHPDKFAFPHALTLDSQGNLYVIEWLPDARPRKFRKLAS